MERHVNPGGLPHFGGLAICSECFVLRGWFGAGRAIGDSALKPEPGAYGHRYYQRCRCQDKSMEAPWVGFDFNTEVELCYCCGAEAITSGSRWSSFYCEECREQVLKLNRSVGRWVIPIGRHSVMHGLLVAGDVITSTLDTSPPRHVACSTRSGTSTHGLTT
jgi:hypothetical protein